MNYHIAERIQVVVSREHVERCGTRDGPEHYPRIKYEYSHLRQRIGLTRHEDSHPQPKGAWIFPSLQIIHNQSNTHRTHRMKVRGKEIDAIEKRVYREGIGIQLIIIHKQPKGQRREKPNYDRSPRNRLARARSLGWMVTRLAWIAAKLVSSKRETRYASEASWSAITADDWKRKSV